MFSSPLGFQRNKRRLHRLPDALPGTARSRLILFGSSPLLNVFWVVKSIGRSMAADQRPVIRKRPTSPSDPPSIPTQKRPTSSLHPTVTHAFFRLGPFLY
ncbi:hypothetical protein PIB30_034532 [Stylosanthes scabra]|uniref:Uncharacterized protein n=1 Tax=Stylosanthes scabra TaxID=79078 RepID=A0ABU6RD03_9FABA|nr:hypothetical protein [Stylosanthes scabra]